MAVEVPIEPEPPAGIVPQLTDPSAEVCKAWPLAVRQLVTKDNLIDELKAALVLVIETPRALLKLKSDEAFRFVVVTFETTMLVPVKEVRLALVEVMFCEMRLEILPLVLVTMVPEAVVKMRLPVKVPPESGK